MLPKHYTIMTLFAITNLVSSQIGFTELSKIGIIQGKNYKLKIRGDGTTQLMVIRFIPNLQNVSSCNSTAAVVEDYKKLVLRIISPINDSISKMKSHFTERTAGVRFIGAILGGVALGVATSAQITAGFALHNSIENAKAIKSMKSAILESNKAIDKIRGAAEKTVTVINSLQRQINSQVIPVLNNLGCQVASNTLGLSLNSYFSEISLIFGPNLQDPSSQTISIQTLSRAFGGDFESMTKTLGYSSQDLLDVLESDLIRARIIDVDMDNLTIGLQIEYPQLIEVPGATIQEFMIISYNDQGSEWISVFPKRLLLRSDFISSIDVFGCTLTSSSYICSQDTSSPISPQLLECARGKTQSCARMRVVTSSVSRFALSEGVVFANCLKVACVCNSKGQSIIQDTMATNTMITEESCKEMSIDSLTITIGKRKLNRTMYSRDVALGPPISTDKIDISNQLAEAQKDLDDAKKHLDKSNSILNKINPNIVNGSSMIFVIIISTVGLLWILISFCWLVTLTKQVRDFNYINNSFSTRSTVNSLSSLISNR